MPKLIDRPAASESAAAASTDEDSVTPRISRDIREALDRIQKRFDDAAAQRERAYRIGYANGFIDALDGREPEFEVSR